MFQSKIRRQVWSLILVACMVLSIGISAVASDVESNPVPGGASVNPASEDASQAFSISSPGTTIGVSTPGGTGGGNLELTPKHVSIVEWKVKAGDKLTSANPATDGKQTENAVFSVFQNKTPSVPKPPVANISGWFVEDETALNDRYWQFQFSTENYTNLAFSAEQSATASGPKTFKLQYSLDGTSFTDLEGSRADLVPNSLSETYSNFALPDEMENQARVYIRVTLASMKALVETEKAPNIGVMGSSAINNVVIKGEWSAGAVAPVTASPASGEAVLTGSSVSLTTKTGNTDIYYTLKGKTVNDAEKLYTGPIPLPAKNEFPYTVEAYARDKDGVITDSGKTVFTYTRLAEDTLAAVATPNSGAVPLGTEIKLTTATPEATIHYTLNGGPEQIYSDGSPVKLDTLPVTLVAYVTSPDNNDSPKTAFKYTDVNAPAPQYNHYYGQLHDHTRNSDGQGEYEDAYTMARAEDKGDLDFFALTEHAMHFDSDAYNNEKPDPDGSENDPGEVKGPNKPGDPLGSLDNAGGGGKNSDRWTRGHTVANSFNKDGEFVAIFGFEMTWGAKQHNQKFGHINVFNTDGYVSTENPRYDVPKGGEPYNFFDDVSAYSGALAQLNHPGSMFGAFDGYKFYNPEYDAFTNLLEVATGETLAIKQRVETQYYNALYEGWHVAPTNNADGHNAMWGTGTPHRTVILAETLSRGSVYDAIRNRRVYATEDKTMKVNYTINNEVMGSILDYEPKNLTVQVSASTGLDIGLGQISLVGRNDGKPTKPRTIQSVDAGSEKTYTWSFTINNADSDFYYVKIDQPGANGYTYTAPIWVKASSVPAGDDPAILGSAGMSVATSDKTVSSEAFSVSGSPEPFVTVDSGEKLTWGNSTKIKWNNATKTIDVAPYTEPGVYPVKMYVRNTQGTATHEFTLTVTEAAGGVEAHNLNLAPGADASSVRLAWMSGQNGSTDSIVQLAEKAAMTGSDFPASFKEFTGSTGAAGSAESWHKAEITGLRPDTAYVYRVANSKGGDFSKIYAFRTGSAGDFKFIALSDAQLNGDDKATKGWAGTVEAFTKEHRDASFVMNAGDLVDNYFNQGKAESQYDLYFGPSALTGIPLASTLGNHDIVAKGAPYDYHANNPNPVSISDAEITGSALLGNYWFENNNALFVVFNTSQSPKGGSAGYFDSILKAATEAHPDAKWIFVQHHKSTVSSATHQADSDVRKWEELLVPLMDKYNVDFVLSGHDHVYTRSFQIGGKTGPEGKIEDVNYAGDTVVNPDGTLYFTLNTASGGKYYDVPTEEGKTYGKNPVWVDSNGDGKNDRPWYINYMEQAYKPQFTAVEVKADSVAFTTYYTETLQVADKYTVVRTGNDADSSEPTGTVPSISGPERMDLTEGYAATSSEAFTVSGEPTAAVTATGSDKIVWNAGTVRLDIAAGLPAGTYPVTVKAANANGAAELVFTLYVAPARGENPTEGDDTGVSKPSGTVPALSGPERMDLTEGYAATSSEAFTVSGESAAAVTATGSDKIVWNAGTVRLDIAAGLPAGTYPVTVKAANANGAAELVFTLYVAPAKGGNPSGNNDSNNNHDSNDHHDSHDSHSSDSSQNSAAAAAQVTEEWATASTIHSGMQSAVKYGVRASAWKDVESASFFHDTMLGNAVQVRVTVQNPGTLTKDAYLSGHVAGEKVDAVRGVFAKWFKNPVRVISFDQPGQWERPLEIAAKIDLAGMDAKNLQIYCYNKAKNTYTRLAGSAYRVDKNGYLHFSTAYAGDIIISSGTLTPLKQK